MVTEVLMPQMGESIAEGTIVRWIKKIGDAVDRDEPLFEISTDKVDAEIPSPGAGVLLEIRVNEGQTVPVNSIVAVIGEQGEITGGRPASAPPALASDAPASQAASAGVTRDALQSQADARATGASPVVRRIADEHGVDISRVTGTGADGRVTKQDILAYVQRSSESSPAGSPSTDSAGDVRIEPMSIMRKKIAEHMVMSAHTSPHVYSVYEVDFYRVEQLRQAKKAEYEAAGARLTYTAFIAKATIDTIKEFPFANASVDGDNIVYRRAIDLGIAVALESGLLVPVIRDAGDRDLPSLCRAIQDLAQRARTKHLKPEEVQGGTFTITNPGVFGASFGLPLLNQPQVAILAVGAIEKRAVVVDDAVVVRPVAYLALGHDHRLIDGLDAGRFLQALKRRLENFGF